MKHVLLALITMTATSAFASAPHCPPGEVNVWGACFPAGSGVFNGVGDAITGHGPREEAYTASAPHCKPPQINVWGACVNRPNWHF